MVNVASGLGKPLRQTQLRREEKVVHMYYGAIVMPGEGGGQGAFSGAGHAVQSDQNMVFLGQQGVNSLRQKSRDGKVQS